VNDKGGSVVIEKINHFHDTSTRPAANDKPLLAVALPRESMAGIADNAFNFCDCATMFGRMLAVPLDPSKLARRHDIVIYETSR
jgi:hypothetical protein